MKPLLVILFCSLLCFRATAQETETPRKKKELRELSPDRPHQTESPITVDPGHIMIETDLANTTMYNKDVPHSNTIGFFYFNFKVGIHKRMDLELMSNALSFTHYQDNALPATHSAFPDLTFR